MYNFSITTAGPLIDQYILMSDWMLLHHKLQQNKQFKLGSPESHTLNCPESSLHRMKNLWETS